MNTLKLMIGLIVSVLGGCLHGAVNNNGNTPAARSTPDVPVFMPVQQLPRLPHNVNPANSGRVVVAQAARSTPLVVAPSTSRFVSSLSELTPKERERYHLSNTVTQQRTLMRKKKSELESKQRALQENPDSAMLKLKVAMAQRDLERCTAALFAFMDRHIALTSQIPN